MAIELEAIMGSGLVTTIFIYGSAAMLVGSMIAMTWLCSETEGSLVRVPLGIRR